MKREPSALTLFLIVVTGSWLWASVELSKTSAWIARGVLAATLVLLLVQMALEQLPHKWLRPPDHGATPADDSHRAPARSMGPVLSALAWMSALPLAIWLFGTVAGSGLFCLAWLRWHSGERWIFSSLFALALAVGAQLLFGVLFRAELPTGLLLRSVS